MCVAELFPWGRGWKSAGRSGAGQGNKARKSIDPKILDIVGSPAGPKLLNIVFWEPCICFNGEKCQKYPKTLKSIRPCSVVGHNRWHTGVPIPNMSSPTTNTLYVNSRCSVARVFYFAYEWTFWGKIVWHEIQQVTNIRYGPIPDLIYTNKKVLEDPCYLPMYGQRAPLSPDW